MEDNPEVSTEKDREDLQARAAYRFTDSRRLLEALTHRSFTHENPGGSEGDNERLEFLGDAVLGLAAAGHLGDSFPEAREGELSRLRSSLVSQGALAAAAVRLGLGACLRLGRGEERSGGREKESILAGAAEALVGAVFLDGGWAPAYGLALRYFQGAAGAGDLQAAADAKTRLQEICQERKRMTPRYRLVEQRGPDHQPLFTVAVLLDGEELALGRGASKKEAEQEAATAAIEGLVPPPGAKE
jgi:ribonuclease-3